MTVNNRPLLEVSQAMRQRIQAEGKTPAIVPGEIQDTDSYALRFGWDSFWALDTQERARVVATYQLDDEIQFVSSHWSQYGDQSPRAAIGETRSPDTDPFRDDAA